MNKSSFSKQMIIGVSVLALLGSSATPLASQVRTVVPPSDTVKPVISPVHKAFLEQKLENAARAQRTKANILNLQNDVLSAYNAKDPARFTQAVQVLNNQLIEYLQSNNLSERIEGAYTLLEQMRLRLITPQDFKRASSIMKKALQNNKTCNEFSCDFLAASAASLAFDAGYIQQLQENPALNERHAKLAFLHSLAATDWGSDKSNSVMASGILRATAALGSAQNLADNAAALILPKQGFFKERAIRSNYDVPNRLTQETVIKTLASLGQEGKDALKKVAFSHRTEFSFVRGNIELAYLPLTEQESLQNQANLKEIYCNETYGLNAQEDFELKRELAYAWGKGNVSAFVTQSGDKSCQITVPVEPDPRKVSEDISDVVTREVVLQAAFLGLPVSGAGLFKKIVAYFQKAGFFRGGFKMMTTAARGAETAGAAGRSLEAVQTARTGAETAQVAQAATKTSVTPAWTNAERLSAMRKITSSGLPEKEFATTFHRFANELDPAAEWFVSGKNVALKGRAEVAKYAKAVEQGVKDIPITDGKVALNIAADLGEEGVSYRLITRPSQLAKLKPQIKPAAGEGTFANAPYTSVEAETANKQALSNLSAKRAEEARVAALPKPTTGKGEFVNAPYTSVEAETANKQALSNFSAKRREKGPVATTYAEKTRLATERAEQARIAANHTEEGRAAALRLEKTSYAAKRAEEARIAAERNLSEVERKIAANSAEEGLSPNSWEAKWAGIRAEETRINAKRAEEARIAAKRHFLEVQRKELLMAENVILDEEAVARELAASKRTEAFHRYFQNSKNQPFSTEIDQRVLGIVEKRDAKNPKEIVGYIQSIKGKTGMNYDLDAFSTDLQTARELAVAQKQGYYVKVTHSTDRKVPAIYDDGSWFADPKRYVEDFTIYPFRRSQRVSFKSLDEADAYMRNLPKQRAVVDKAVNENGLVLYPDGFYKAKRGTATVPLKNFQDSYLIQDAKKKGFSIRMHDGEPMFSPGQDLWFHEKITADKIGSYLEKGLKVRWNNGTAQFSYQNMEWTDEPWDIIRAMDKVK